MKNIKRIFNDFSIRTKIIIFYVLLMLVSIVLCVMLFVRSNERMMSEKVSTVSNQVVESINVNIDLMIKSVNNNSKILLANETVQNILNRRDSYDSLSSLNAMRENLSRFIDFAPFINAIYVFDNNGNKYHVENSESNQFDFESIQQAPWYDELIQRKGGYLLKLNAGGNNGFTDQNHISLIRIINDINTQKPIGILVMNIPEKSFYEAYKKIENDYGTEIMILNHNGQSIVKNRVKHLIKTEEQIMDIDKDQFYVDIFEEDNVDYVLSHLYKAEYEWRIVTVMPFNELSKENARIRITIFLIIIVNSVLILIGSWIIARIITNPIHDLIDSMQSINNGEFKKVKGGVSNDEIGRLRNVYNIMNGTIEELITKIVKEEEKKRKAELAVMQEQIKPHFLYNSLDAISSLAVMNGNKQVYSMVKALGTYYRTSLGKGKEAVTLLEEITNVKSYLEIQKVRYGDLVTYSFDIEEKCNEFIILKHILQPLVENSIYHGIKNKGEMGEISISAKCVDDHGENIRIIIADDGIGMDDATIDSIRKAKSDGIGLVGTIERLRMFYGRKDILEIHSEKGVGTQIVLMIPQKWKVKYNA